jgi:hypothetical protein
MSRLPRWPRLLAAAIMAAIAEPSAGLAQVGTDSLSGPVIDFAQPPPDAAAWSSACSRRHPLCIHGSHQVPSPVVLAALASTDRAWEVLTGVLALPPPEPDLDGAWHEYLLDGHDALEETGLGDGARLRERDPRSHFDSATSFGLVDAGAPTGCPLDVAVARAVARASLWRAAPAADPGSARAQTEALVRLAVPCEGDQGDLQEFQSDPERTLVDPSSWAFDRGASLFFDWLDTTFARGPGQLIGGLWALAPTRTPPAAPRWRGAPTSFDVIRESLKAVLPADSTLDDLFVRFAVRRALLTPAARLAWHVPWPLKPRRLASPEPVFPTGASYVLVDRAGAATDAKLRMEAEWEDYGRMRWVVVKLDAAGQARAVVPVKSLDRGTRASLTVESLGAVDRVLIVGVNVGSTEHPFDPNQGEWEPHGWLLTLAAE